MDKEQLAAIERERTELQIAVTSQSMRAKVLVYEAAISNGKPIVSGGRWYNIK